MFFFFFFFWLFSYEDLGANKRGKEKKKKGKLDTHFAEKETAHR